jgi:hypothetical protein
VLLALQVLRLLLPQARCSCWVLLALQVLCVPVPACLLLPLLLPCTSLDFIW